ncbi:YegP family protein [Kitasatospora sp. NPDC003701]
MRPVEEVARMAGKFEVYEDAGGKYRFRLKAGNGEIVATGQGYASKEAAHKGVDAVRRAAADASVVDVKAAA